MLTVTYLTILCLISWLSITQTIVAFSDAFLIIWEGSTSREPLIIILLYLLTFGFLFEKKLSIEVFKRLAWNKFSLKLF